MRTVAVLADTGGEEFHVGDEAMLAAVKDPAVIKQLEQQVFETQSSTPAELKAFIAKELQRWERVIKDNQIKVAL